jgi:hypothetical protein
MQTKELVGEVNQNTRADISILLNNALILGILLSPQEQSEKFQANPSGRASQSLSSISIICSLFLVPIINPFFAETDGIFLKQTNVFI